MRIEILQLSLEDYDLLLLDEPTNHLDMLSISELVDALNDYEGTLVIISHDRDFVDKTCNKLLYLYNGKGYYYEGPYEEFKEKELNKIIQQEKEKLAQEEEKEKQEKALKKAEEKPVSAPQKKTRLTREPPEKIMEKIDKLEAKKKALSDACYLEENYTDPQKMKDLENQMNALDVELKKLYDELDLAMQ